MSSPTSRTLEYERKQGNIVQIVEYWHAFSRKRRDLFNCIDVVSLTTSRIKGIQCTSRSNHSAREKKAQETHAIRQWIQCGGLFEVQSWGKNSKGRWVQRITRGYLDEGEQLKFRALDETTISKTKNTQRPSTISSSLTTSGN